MTQPVEPPAEETQAEHDPIRRAASLHDQMDAMKVWSQEIARSLREDRAALMATEEASDDEIETIDGMIDLVETVYDRIETGDRNRARQP